MRVTTAFGIVLLALVSNGECTGAAIASSSSFTAVRERLQAAWTNDLTEAWRISTNRLDRIATEQDHLIRFSLLEEYVQAVLSLGMGCHGLRGDAYHLRLDMLNNAVNMLRDSDAEVMLRWKCRLQYFSLLEKERREFDLTDVAGARNSVCILPVECFDMDTGAAKLRQRNLVRFRTRSERLKRRYYAEFLIREMERMRKKYFSDGSFRKDFRKLSSSRRDELLNDVEALHGTPLYDRLIRQTTEKSDGK